jgi:DNA-directed RNA polymerase specialized sigma24 family protein
MARRKPISDQVLRRALWPPTPADCDGLEEAINAPNVGFLCKAPTRLPKARENRGGDWQRVDLEHLEVTTSISPDQLVALDDALVRLAALDPLAGELVKLRYFAGLPLGQAAAALGVSTATAYRHWAYARAWLHGELLKDA